MDSVNTEQRFRSFQLPEAYAVFAGQLAPELIRSSARLPTDHIGDLPATTQCGLQTPAALTASRSQHRQLLPGQAGETGMTNGFSGGKHPGMNTGSREPRCGSCGSQLTRSNSEKQTMARQGTAGNILNPRQK